MIFFLTKQMMIKRLRDLLMDTRRINRKKRKYFVWRGKGEKFMKQMQINWMFCAHGNQKKSRNSVRTSGYSSWNEYLRKHEKKNRLEINELNCCLKLFMQMNESVIELWILSVTIEIVIKWIVVYMEHWLKNKY